MPKHIGCTNLVYNVTTQNITKEKDKNKHDASNNGNAFNLKVMVHPRLVVMLLRFERSVLLRNKITSISSLFKNI